MNPMKAKTDLYGCYGSKEMTVTEDDSDDVKVMTSISDVSLRLEF